MVTLSESAKKNVAELFLEIDKIYDSLPKLNCCKDCFDSCGVIPLFWAEWYRIEQRLGKPMPLADVNSPKFEGYCPLLVDKKCSVYEVRPIICRLWGLVEAMPCIFGCKPEKILPEEKSLEALGAVNKLSDEIYRVINGKEPGDKSMMVNVNVERGLSFTGDAWK
jgi:uncharacterized protein